jgi:hypothetical protein
LLGSGLRDVRLVAGLWLGLLPLYI